MPPRSGAPQPNILILCADQLSWLALPLAGNQHYQTPNIDRITRRGTAFAQCYTATPLCQPARAALWTGHFPHQTGVLSNGQNHPVPPVPPHLPALGEWFSRAGYRAAHFGKTHDAGALRGFEIEPVRELAAHGVGSWPVTYDTRQDRYATTKAVEFLRSPLGPPFLAVADLNNPHNICDWIGANQGPHQDLPLEAGLPPLPPNFRDSDAEFTQRPLPIQYLCCSHNRLAQAARWSAANYRHYLAAYGHYLSRLDAEIGLILDALEARPDAAETLIVFMADHGDGLAAHGMVTKQVTFQEETMRVPFCFAGPGVPPQVLDGPLVSLLDLLPTLCDYAGLGVPPGLWGRSLASWLRGGPPGGAEHPYVAAEWHTEWGDTIEPGRMIRTPRYKYTRYLENQGEELYDLRSDPGETRTLIHDAAHASVLDKHRRLLEAHLAVTGDPFFSLQPQVEARWRSHKPGYRHHVGPTAPMERQLVRR